VYAPDTIVAYPSVFNALFLTRLGVRFVLDTFMTYQFLSVLVFIGEKKGGWHSFTTYNKIVMIATLILLACFLTKAFMSSICFTLLNTTYFSFKEEVRVILRFLTNPVHWTLEFLIFCGFMYLLHVLGKKKKEPPVFHCS
jgi:hypothetical protein